MRGGHVGQLQRSSAVQSRALRNRIRRQTASNVIRDNYTKIQYQVFKERDM
jgi:hypothetical protein